MKEHRRSAVILIVTMAILHSFLGRVTAQDAIRKFDQALAQKLYSAIDQERANQGVKGVSAAVNIPNQGLWQGVSGLSGQAPPDTIAPDTRFALASITKTFTAVLVLKLSEEDRLALQDPLHRWLPKFPNIDPNITVLQLLNHTSGVFNFTNNPTLWNTNWALPNRIWKPTEIIDAFVGPPVFQPGSGLEYSNTNYLLLQMIVEAVTDSSVSALFRNRFFNPLGLKSTFLPAEEPVTGNVAHNWSDTNKDGELEDLSTRTGLAMYSMSRAGGGLVSTAEDAAKWADALYGGRILNSESLTQMLNFEPVSSNSYWTGYGLGAMQMNLGGEEIWGHTGLLPGYRSFLAYVPSIGASICVLVNQEDFAKPSIFVELLLATVKGFLVTALPIQAGKSEFNTFELHQNYPNPFNQATTFVFNLSIPSHVSIDVYNVHGRRVANVLNDHYVPGIHRINWEAQALASGLYLYRLTAGGFSLTQSLLLLR